MWTDVVDLNEFYHSPLGQTARRIIRPRIRALWPNVRGMTVLGLGYAAPYLTPFRKEAARTLAVMPPNQGAMPWPRRERGLVCLADEVELPFEDLSIDRLLLIHAVECSEQLRAMMREAWRVLSESGRMIVVVPNRRGIWARVEGTPFGHGYPFSKRQLRRLLQDCLFTPMVMGNALYAPPLQRRMLLSAAPALERIGGRLYPTFSGVLIVEASKQIYAATPVAASARRRRLVVLPGGAASAHATKRVVERGSDRIDDPASC
ncbi:MAG: methyltransferase domain-containing protein [Alphaproteobacteria bacterium]|nr:methyltransferase domain-containing protein [Alphaproteobacteria bacterium]